MTHSKEEIIKALTVIHDTCYEMEDCEECPFGNDFNICRITENYPEKWTVTEVNRWRALA